jgi:hypothetical protein
MDEKQTRQQLIDEQLARAGWTGTQRKPVTEVARDRSSVPVSSRPLERVRIGCFLGGDAFRDFIQGLLEGDRALDQELVGHKQWRKAVALADLLGEIAAVREVDRDELLSRRKSHVERDAAMYLCREIGQRTLREIAALFGVKYAAVSLACRRVRDTVSDNKRFAKTLACNRQAIINRLKT